MKKVNRVIANIVTCVCVLLAGALFCHLILGSLQSEQFIIPNGQGTRFDFISNSDSGFNCEKIIYTEDGITSIIFSGKITVDGIADISVISDDGSIVYSETYSDVKAESIKFEVTDLTPYAYYTLRFSSDKAKAGNLALTTDKSLMKSLELREKTEKRGVVP